jgi:hypothetical protein
VPEPFEAFYRMKLRYFSGARLRSLEVAALYAAWADAHCAPSLNLRQRRRAMVNIGHAHFKSNGMFFADVRLASDAPHLSDNFPEGPAPGPARLGAIGRIDRIALELEQLRREVTTGCSR